MFIFKQEIAKPLPRNVERNTEKNMHQNHNTSSANFQTLP